MFGKVIEFPRWQASFGQAYSFTGVSHTANKIFEKNIEMGK
jgi:hypothetical protein